ncbi:MAG TPA: hypothetical protein PKI34_13440 [Bacteroidales bacterium]|nr:hypothetical protein [Bacteroidales bacterium]
MKEIRYLCGKDRVNSSQGESAVTAGSLFYSPQNALSHLETDWMFRVIITHQQLPEIRNMKFQLWQIQHNKEDQFFMFLADVNDNLIVIKELRGIEFPLPLFFIIVYDGVVQLQNEYSP